jgi:Ig-like domain CHU_C associated
LVSPIPTAPTVANVLISSGASASLTATCATGTPVWYASSTATTSLGVGNYITPALTVNTTYYVACETSPGGTSMTNPQNCVSSRVEQVVTIDVFAIVSHQLYSWSNGSKHYLSMARKQWFRLD